MSDRLTELFRQRALVAEHLAWLDREIARLGNAPAAHPGQAAPAPSAPAATPAPAIPDALRAAIPATTTPPTGVATDAATPPAEEIPEQYRFSPTTVHQDVRKGCLLYFAAAFVVLGLVVAILYFTIGRH